MSILQRPMFRKGGKVDSRGTGITSGLDTPKRGLVDGPGGYAGVEETYREKLARLKAEQPKLSLGDYLQIAATGAEIAGAPSMGGGISGALTTAAKPLATLGRGLAGSFGAREKATADLAGTLTGLEIEKEIGMAKATRPFESQIQMNFIDEYYKDRIAAAKTQVEKDILIRQREEEKRTIARGGNLASKYKVFQPEIVKNAQQVVRKSLKETLGREPTPDELAKGVAKYLSTIAGEFGQNLKDGGRVGYQEGGEVMNQTQQEMGVEGVETQGEEAMSQISYNELRARLPQEITDDIVKLLANSYEALADFAEIRTQADVDNFNQKYNVQLVLPAEA